MKLYFILFIVSLFFYSCQHTKPKEETKISAESERFKKIRKRIERNLNYDKEKIILLSEIRKIPFDTLNFILLDYFVATDTILSFDKKSKYLYQNSIVKISEKYKISKSKITSLIFSYKYEMLTREDIEENAIEDFKDNYVEEASESEDPY